MAPDPGFDIRVMATKKSANIQLFLTVKGSILSRLLLLQAAGVIFECDALLVEIFEVKPSAEDPNLAMCFIPRVGRPP